MILHLAPSSEANIYHVTKEYKSGFNVIASECNATVNHCCMSRAKRNSGHFHVIFRYCCMKTNTILIICVMDCCCFSKRS